METAPSEDPQGAAEETVEVDDEKELVGYPNAPNKDTTTIVKVVTGQDVTIPSKEKSALKFQLVTTITLNILPDQQG